MINAIIVEDEKFHMSHFSALLTKAVPEVNVIAKFYSGNEVLKVVNNLSFDLMFLDIDLGDMLAFELLEKITTDNYRIIFITAYFQYAVQAFRVNAVDYLLKPVKAKELKESVSRIMSRDTFGQKKKDNLLTDYHLRKNRILMIQGTEHITFIPLDNIFYCESSDNYTKIIYENEEKEQTIISHKNLLYFEKKLSELNFLRISQSYIVNINKIVKIDKKKKEVVLQNGTKKTISKRKQKEVYSDLKKRLLY